MKVTSIRVGSGVTIRLGDSSSFSFIKPEVTLEAVLSENDDVQKVYAKLAKQAKYLLNRQALDLASQCSSMADDNLETYLQGYFEKIPNLPE